MSLVAFFCLLVILPTFTSAQKGCTYGGKSYAAFETFPHSNGCAQLQCQNGTTVTIEEACGRELDKKCHKVNEEFLYQRQTYACYKNPGGDYELDLAPPGTMTCQAEGKTFQDLENFKLSDGCRNFQCQDETVTTINPEYCGKELDGDCHFLGSWTESKGKIYKCDKKDVGGKPVYSYTEIKPTPDLSETCTLSSKKYKNLEIFKNRVDQCDSRQCQNGKLVYLNRVCRFVQDNRKCYPVGHRWTFNNRAFECIEDPVTGDAKAARVIPKPRPCVDGSKTYDHLEIVKNGCETKQCQSGQLKVIESGCKDSTGKCYSTNYSWKDGTVTFKCIYHKDWGWTISRIFDDKPVPVCVTPGKDVYFILDDSGSIKDENYQKQKQFSADLTRRFYIGTNTNNSEYQFGAIIFSTEAYDFFGLRKYLDQNALYQALLTPKYSAGWTRTEKALNLVVDNNVFGTVKGGRDNAQNYVVLLTDGESNAPPLTQTAAARVRSVAKIICVGVGPNVNNAELLGISGSQSQVVNINGYNVIEEVQDMLSEKICTAQ